jgi:disulfide bond formation protein DsbB
MTKKILLYFIWFIAIVATLGSLYASLILGLTPCLLCWYQRILMYPLVIIIGVGIWKKIKYLNYLIFPFSLVGLGFAFYHNLLQLGIIQEKITVCSLETPCVTSGQLPGFISLPMLSLTAFVLINIATIIYYYSNQEKE